MRPSDDAEFASCAFRHRRHILGRIPYRRNVNLAPSPVPWLVSLVECCCHDQPPSVVATLPAATHSAGAFLFGWLHCEVRLRPSLASLRRSIRVDVSQMPLGYKPACGTLFLLGRTWHLWPGICRWASMCGLVYGGGVRCPTFGSSL